MKCAIRALRVVALFLGCVCACEANELSDSMQLFFDGQVQQSHQRLSALIQQGHQDARIFYFRGLANNRLGHRDAAAADFQRAATLELSGATHVVGQALQRVQGSERLLLERHRTMARLVHRRRSQPPAPKPQIESQQAVYPIQLATTSSHGPRFRLGSEIPIREQLADPFVDEPASNMLSGEQQPVGPSAVPSAQLESPVGTGVVQASSTAEAVDPSDSRPNMGNASVKGSTSGFFGALRAIRSAVVPKIDPTQFVPGMPGAPTGDAPGDGDFDSESSDDPFENALFGE